MVSKYFYSFVFLAGSALAVQSSAQSTSNWDRAEGTLPVKQSTHIAGVIDRWQVLTKNDRLSFASYAEFVLAYPEFPKADDLQLNAEAALDRAPVSSEAMVALFDKHPPLTNAARARYALALAALGRPEAFETARKAWRGGTMSGPTEIYLLGLFGSRLDPADQDARMDALLWQGDLEAAKRQIARVSPERRPLAQARLALLEGQAPQAQGLTPPSTARSNPGYVYNLSRYYRASGQMAAAVNLLATAPDFTTLPFDPERMVGEMLRVARSAGSEPAIRIAASVDELFPANADISAEGFALRDDYTSLVWLGGTSALWNLGQPERAAPLFYRYGAAARTPPTRSKGFYWAGYAASRAGNMAEAKRYWEMAAQYPERFYGQLALRDLGRDMPAIKPDEPVIPYRPAKEAFNKSPLTKAVREVALDAPWSTGIQFYQAIARNADTPEEHALVAQLAREIGRRDLAVNVAEAAGADGIDRFVAQGFPTIPLPPGANFTLVHAIARQESQFAQNAISHAGARGLMQLMPGTARESANRAGLAYMSASLVEDPQYNIRLGNNYIQRMLAYYDGSYPLAIAAYNAGPGNVNDWLRANGDPRTGAISWIGWIERIPFTETKYYVQRVIENAAVYEHLYPEKSSYGRPRMAGDFLH